MCILEKQFFILPKPKKILTKLNTEVNKRDMKTITELLAEKKENKVALEKAKVEHERIDSELIKFYEGYHKKLRDLNFYTRFIFYHRHFGDIFGRAATNLSAEYRLNNSLPYKSLGEGDYACIRFKANDGKLSLRHTVSCNRDANFHICDIPLALFDFGCDDLICAADSTKNKLEVYLDGVIAANDKSISEAVEKSKAKKRNELEAELSKLL